MFFSVRLLHVDEHAFYPQEEQEIYEQNLQKMRDLAASTKLQFVILKIEDELGLEVSQCRELMAINDPKGSCREDVLAMLRNRVVYRYAKNEKLTKIIVGDNGLRVSLMLPFLPEDGIERVQLSDQGQRKQVHAGDLGQHKFHARSKHYGRKTP